MKVNADLIKEMREDKSWSQEELAIAAGLNLRTVQRVEKEASASLQSKKSLAAALEIHVRDLDYEEISIIKRYEYKTIEIDPKEGFLTGVKRGELPDFSGALNVEGKDGWQVIQILTPDIAQGVWAGKSGRIVALLQREYTE
ncbi:MAG: DUF4177 domain-containing protein [Pseudomonadales bacterium]|nr:DUF4177 domain-containing protein [Pseudomonadales bacterium]